MARRVGDMGPRGSRVVLVGALVAAACGGEPSAGEETAHMAVDAAEHRFAVAPAGDGNSAVDEDPHEAAARDALVRMRVEDLPAHLTTASDDERPDDLGGVRALSTSPEDGEVTDALVQHSGLDDLLLVMHAQAEHLRMSGEVVLSRADDGNDVGAPEVSEVVVELALSAQDAADALQTAVAKVSDEQGLFIPASAVSANHTVVERLSRTDGKRFSDAYIAEQMGTLKRAKKTLKQAFALNPNYANILERAARRLNRAFELFDFVRSEASQAVSDPVGAIRFGSGFVEHASEMVHGGSGELDSGEPQTPREEEVEARDEAKASRRVHFAPIPEASPATARPATL